ncbi:MAG TPA: hypothetical protein VMW48_04785 [Vicinamibacterales bacterium]|nr:hypothetical protein [Vicinamibacterales bacterium]
MNAGTLALHELFRRIPPLTLTLMIVIPLAMSAAALVLGWQAQRAAVRRRASPDSPRGPAEDALGAGITVAVVPFAFAVLVIWARFF